MSYQVPGNVIYAITAPSVPLDFGGDLSANRRTQWIFFGRGEKWPSLDLKIPAGVTGAFTLECSNDPTRTTGAPHSATADAAWVAAQPAGSGADLIMDKINATTAVYLAVVWTWASGGTGIVPTIATMGI